MEMRSRGSAFISEISTSSCREKEKRRRRVTREEEEKGVYLAEERRTTDGFVEEDVKLSGIAYVPPTLHTWLQLPPHLSQDTHWLRWIPKQPKKGERKAKGRRE